VQPGDYVVATRSAPRPEHLRLDWHERHDYRRHLLRTRNQSASRISN
jgi:hypothetical protein